MAAPLSLVPRHDGGPMTTPERLDRGALISVAQVLTVAAHAILGGAPSTVERAIVVLEGQLNVLRELAAQPNLAKCPACGHAFNPWESR